MSSQSGQTPPPPRPVAGVSVVVVRHGQVLLVKRGNPRAFGLWSLPGGKVELGEEVRQAALRELNEETGIDAKITGLIDCIDIINRTASGEVESHFILSVFQARWLGGEVVAGDDASDVLWAAPDDLKSLDMTPGTADFIARVLSR
jgi:ADP-ribose pyrophosphatase YjhB (NUDIX family)